MAFTQFFDLNDLHFAWAAFWLNYWITGSLYPKVQSKTIKDAEISKKALFLNLAQNMLLTFSWTFVFNLLPTLYARSNTWIEYVGLYIFLFILSEGVNYYVHRLLHHPRLYFIHKDHHKYIHSEPLAGLYVSRREMIIQSPLLVMMIYKLIGFRRIEMIVWSLFYSMHSLNSHSGVAQGVHDHSFLSEIICFVFDDSFHASHHCLGKVNFGFWGIFDLLHGTYRDPARVIRKYN